MESLEVPAGCHVPVCAKTLFDGDFLHFVLLMPQIESNWPRHEQTDFWLPQGVCQCFNAYLLATSFDVLFLFLVADYRTDPR